MKETPNDRSQAVEGVSSFKQLFSLEHATTGLERYHPTYRRRTSTPQRISASSASA
jgi:hypothetical protein